MAVPTSERFKKLVLMLSSDKDGEVVNAAHAIGRELRAAGLTGTTLPA
jgi:hypothetical protein